MFRAVLSLGLALLSGCGEDPRPPASYEGRSAALWARDLRGDVLAGTSKTIDRLGAAGMDAVPLLAELVRKGRDAGDAILAQGLARAVSLFARPEVVAALEDAAPSDGDAALILQMVEQSLGELERALIRSLTDRDPGIRLRAVEGLERLGRSARGARAALEAAGQDTDQRVRDAAAKALDAIRRRGQ